MEEIKEKSSDFIDHVEGLANTYYKLALLNVTEKTANIISSAFAMMVVGATGAIALLFSGLALCWWLGNLTGSRVGGFLLGALFFLVMMIVIILIRKKTLFPFFRDLIIRKII